MLRRINVMEVALGYKRSTHAIANGGKPCKFTAGAYSDHLQHNLKPLFDSLAAELAA
jgi:hypothetical protein